MSPPSTANTQVETRIFQFPPSSVASTQVVKQEDWTTATLGTGSTNPCLQTEFVPSNSPNNQQQCSPMAISPSLSTLNTPRGSITSMRSQQSPMNTDQGVQPNQQTDPMMTYEPFDACTTAFVSYTTVQSNTFPSPPRSPTVSSSTHQHFDTTYEDSFYGGAAGSLATLASSDLIGASSAGSEQPPVSSTSGHVDMSFFSTKIEPLDPHPQPHHAQHPSSIQSPIFMSSSAAASVMTNYGSTPDPTESFVSSDCPETPDSSVKEEAEGVVNSPDTGSYVCLWMECNEEFVTQKTLVDHINDNHMETKKGCDEFPCLWKVSLVLPLNFVWRFVLFGTLPRFCNRLEFPILNFPF